MTPPARPRHLALVTLALAALVALPFLQALGFAFVNLDDNGYVYANAVVRRGLTLDGIAWAFTNVDLSNWHPVTWLSHLLDVSLFGLAPAGHHAVSVGLHVANALLLFAFLRVTTGSLWRSALVAALFGVHPLHVESVAWVAERKDVLSTWFLLLALHAHARWAARPTAARFAAVLAASALGILSKPTLVTLPLVLLLADLWPLQRVGAVRARTLLAEKLPVAALAAASAIVTYAVQAGAGHTSALTRMPLGARVANALVAYPAYLVKALWPEPLASFYPHPYTLGLATPGWQVAGAALFLAAGTFVAWRQRRERPWLAWGWAWYAVTLAPMAGFVPVGGQALADRYTYVPLIGPFVALVWAVAERVARTGAARWARPALGIGAGALLTVLTALSWRQVGTWRDSVTLHQHAVQNVEGAWKSWQGLCTAYTDLGRFDDALQACREAARIRPGFPQAWNQAGIALLGAGAVDEATSHFREALRLQPEYPEALNNLGAALARGGRIGDAAPYFAEAARLAPNDAQAWLNLGLASTELGDRATAEAILARLLQLDPARAEQLRVQLAR